VIPPCLPRPPLSSKSTGYNLQLAVKTDDFEVQVASGTNAATSKPVTVKDSFAFGSGTKPYVASSIMQLVEKKAVSLDDPVHKHIDPVLTRLNGTTFVKLFGPTAADVTVGHVLQMRSGIADFDVPAFDDLVLSSNWGSPFRILDYAGGLTPQFVCAPGSCVMYSSTNYELAGLVLMALHGAKDWPDLAERVVFPAAVAADFPNSQFLNQGPLSSALTVPGVSSGPVTIFNQDASVLGWTCGNLIAPASEVARFFHDLVGPTPMIVSAESLEVCVGVFEVSVSLKRRCL
jgi:D-alanyl-D-alanine carboxypeptidase